MKKISKSVSIQHIEEIPEQIRRIFVTAHDITPEWHIRMQATFQKYTDNAVSKTVNFPHHASMNDIEQAYLLAYKLGCKGVTVYRDGSRSKQVLERGETKTPTEVSFIKPRTRPEKTFGVTYEMQTGCGSLYVTINEDEKNLPFEVFARLGKAGGCASAQTEGLGRSASLILRCGVDPKEIVKHYKGITCDRQCGVGKYKILSCPDAIGKALERYLKEKELLKEEDNKMLTLSRSSERENPVMINGACPDCGSPLVRVEGCKKCISNCGYTECD